MAQLLLKQSKQIQNQNRGAGLPGEKRCLRCKLKNHTHTECRTDLSKLCSTCNKFGHTSDTCRKGQRYNTHGQNNNNTSISLYK